VEQDSGADVARAIFRHHLRDVHVTKIIGPPDYVSGGEGGSYKATFRRYCSRSYTNGADATSNMRLRKALLVAALALCLLSLPRAQGTTITVNTASTDQTFRGWEATAGGTNCSNDNIYRGYNSTLYGYLADLNVTRVRLETRAYFEHTTDWWGQYCAGSITFNRQKEKMAQTVNDNRNPNVINSSGFIWTRFDTMLDLYVVPWRNALASRGKSLFVSLCYVAFTGQNVPSVGYNYHHANASEYAEFILAAFQHMDAVYGFHPDGVEIMLEPDNAVEWANNGTYVGQALKAVGDKLAAAGYHPEFTIPSNETINESTTYLKGAMAVRGAASYATVAATHRYTGNSGISTFASTAIGTYGLKTAMLEFLGADYQTLMEDLKTMRVSWWSPYAVGGTGFSADCDADDNGGAIFCVQSGPVLKYYSRIPRLKEFFTHIDNGDVRISASSSNSGAADPVAFRRANGSYVVLANTTTSQSFSVTGLPAGTYHIEYQTSGSVCTVPCNPTTTSDQTIVGGGTVATSIPGAGTLVVFNDPPAGPAARLRLRSQ
jgi:hypothetical protein